MVAIVRSYLGVRISIAALLDSSSTRTGSWLVGLHRSRNIHPRRAHHYDFVRERSEIDNTGVPLRLDGLCHTSVLGMHDIVGSRGVFASVYPLRKAI